jgi:hypothetical protein
MDKFREAAKDADVVMYVYVTDPADSQQPMASMAFLCFAGWSGSMVGSPSRRRDPLYGK